MYWGQPEQTQALGLERGYRDEIPIVFVIVSQCCGGVMRYSVIVIRSIDSNERLLRLFWRAPQIANVERGQHCDKSKELV